MKVAQRILMGFAVIGIGGWTVLLLWGIWWMIQPVTVPTITEPIPVLNPGNEIAIGETIILELDVAKPQDFLSTDSERFLLCESGNLVTLQSTPQSQTTLPVGEYTLVVDNVDLPNKVTTGDVCTHVFRVTYEVNPLRSIEAEYTSEPFTISPPPP
jgi:hypothetical protein